MPRFQRSKLAQVQVWINQRGKAIGKLLRPKWFGKAGRSLRVGLFRGQKAILATLTPKWLRKSGKVVQKRLRRAEVVVTKTGSQVGKTVAKSSVGTQAKNLARSGRILENRLITTAKFIGLILTALVPAPIRRLFRKAGLAFWRVFGVFFVFVGRWFRTRRYWQLLGGLPAFAMALPLAYCMVRLPFHTPAAKSKHYQRAAQEALQEEEFSKADLYYRKLAQLGAMSELASYQSAHNQYLSGDRTAAFARMSLLAPDDRTGFPPAHLWIVYWYLNRENKDVSAADALRLANQHVDLALKRDPSNPYARALRARLMLADADQRRSAFTELKQLASVIPSEGIYLAKMYARAGDWESARVEVDRVREGYEQKLATGGELYPEEYLIYASAYAIVGDMDQREQILKSAQAAFPSNTAIRDQLCQQLMSSADVAYRRRRGDPSDVVQRLLQAAELQPDEEAPMIRLGEYARDSNAFAKYIRQAIGELVDGPQAPDRLHSVMGPLAVGEGDLATAERWLREAVKRNPQDHFSLNNLAYVVVSQSETNAAEALTFVDLALTLDPEQAMYKETRGQILLKLKRYQEAVDDLVFALNGLGDLPEVHAALAQAYDRLGQREQAKIHRQRSKAVSGS